MTRTTCMNKKTDMANWPAFQVYRTPVSLSACFKDIYHGETLGLDNRDLTFALSVIFMIAYFLLRLHQYHRWPSIHNYSTTLLCIIQGQLFITFMASYHLWPPIHSCLHLHHTLILSYLKISCCCCKFYTQFIVCLCDLSMSLLMHMIIIYRKSFISAKEYALLDGK